MQNVSLFSISADHSLLLVSEFRGGVRSPFWAFPPPAGSLRRLGDISGKEAVWSRDTRQLAFADGLDLYLADADGGHPRKLKSFDKILTDLKFSPDGQHLRFTLKAPGSTISSIWEIGTDGTNLQQVLPRWKPDAMQCCGDWTHDGSYYIFQIQPPGGSMELWALSERRLPLRKHAPVQLTTGPVWYMDVAPSPDSDRIFVNGEMLQAELVRYDAKSRQFAPFLSGVSAGEADFSPDGQWIVYVSYPDLVLWKSRIDGSERTQLTYAPIFGTLPRWSPDGSQIAFVGTQDGRPWKIYLMSPQGGTPHELFPEDRQEADASWSPDGKRIAFGRPSYSMDVGNMEIQIFDTGTRTASHVAGSEGMFSPRWSPDGSYLAALSTDSKKLMRLDFETGQWTEWLRADDGTVGYPVWARDSKSIYVERFFGSEPSMHRLKLGETVSQRILKWDDLRRFGGVWGHWSGVAPDGSVLAVRDMSSHEVYALDLSLP